MCRIVLTRLGRVSSVTAQRWSACCGIAPVHPLPWVVGTMRAAIGDENTKPFNYKWTSRNLPFATVGFRCTGAAQSA
jgi:hypothetical protein